MDPLLKLSLKSTNNTSKRILIGELYLKMETLRDKSSWNEEK